MILHHSLIMIFQLHRSDVFLHGFVKQ